MPEDLVTALEITVLGMALVFGAIAVLWLVMVLLMRATEEYAHLEARATEDDLDVKKRAAIAAVAVALAREKHLHEPHAFPLPPTAIVSAWQAVQRGRVLSQKGSDRR